MGQSGGWWADQKFSLGALEEGYRTHYLAVDKGQAVLGLIIGVCAVLALSYIDFLFFRLTRPFIILTLIRIVFCLFSLGVFFWLRRIKRPSSLDNLMLFWWLALAAVILSVDISRPPSYVQNQVLYALAAFACYTVAPVRFRSRMIPALMLSLSAVAILIFFKDPLSRPALAITLAAHIITHVVGILVSERMYAYRRQGYLAERHVHDVVRELERLAITDSLTGLLNRGNFIDHVELELCRIRRSGTTSSLLMMDLDHFKEINDTYGHPIGDEVLRQFSAFVTTQKRCNDQAGRLGGEEFAVLLQDTVASEAVHFAGRILQGCAQLHVETPRGTPAPTVSIGVSELQPLDPSADTVLTRADAALYRAKANGRNRCEME